ncbi:hypothetical protein NDU88_005325 [Pleurodeles waltl]|uniref:Uncharacterized protein n=1 Tax=Pleurodeles waltl TaxID=8319 RepID=A0AAV7LMG8_PLEWA|nr:hypothetical protein NDU88_005325 [Pleurodeles waltl]
MLYTTAHGTPTFANLPEVLKQIQDEYGAAQALDLGMQLMSNFTTVSSIILRHQRVGIHVKGNTLADEAANSAVAMASVAAVTRSKLKVDDETLEAVAASADGMSFPKAYPSKYFYRMAGLFDAQVTIPGVGV